MTDNEFLLPSESELQRLMADIYPDICRSLVGAKVNPELPFGDLFPERLDWIFQDVIDWIATTGQQIKDFFTYWWSRFVDILANIWNWIFQQASNAISNWWYGVQSTFYWMRDRVLEIWNRVYAIGDEVYHNVSQALGGVANTIINSISSFFRQLPGMLNTLGQNIWSWLISVRDTITQTVWPWIQDLGQKIGNWFTDQWNHLVDWWNGFVANFQEWLGNINNLLAPLLKGIGDIPGQVLAGIIDIGKSLWDKAVSWVTDDVSQGIKALEKDSFFADKQHDSPITELLFRGLSLAFASGSDYFLNHFAEFTPESIESTPSWVHTIAQWEYKLLSWPLTELTKMLEKMGPMAPQPGGQMLEPIIRVMMVTMMGLMAFTIGGEVVGFFKHIGMGHISAMIYDVVNYKTLTGAFFTVLAGVYITQPLKYYYNALARPQLPGVGDLVDMAKEYALANKGGYSNAILSPSNLDSINSANKEMFITMMKYHGYSDEWSNALYEVADTPERYFPLRAMADSGEWDEGYYTSALMNSGYNVTTIKKLLSMLRRYSLGEIKSIFITTAISRFKQGFTSVGDFKTELLALGVGDTRIDNYVYGAQLGYQLDYASDLLAAYRTQYNKGMVTEAEFRTMLEGIGIMPERIHAYVLIENAKKFKAPKTMAIPEPVPEYLTDDGQLRVSASKEAFRRNLTSAAELYAEIIRLQMPPDLAEAFTQYEIIRKTPPAAE